jgi:hypothetical protein
LIPDTKTTPKPDFRAIFCIAGVPPSLHFKSPNESGLWYEFAGIKKNLVFINRGSVVNGRGGLTIWECVAQHYRRILEKPHP